MNIKVGSIMSILFVVMCVTGLSVAAPTTTGQFGTVDFFVTGNSNGNVYVFPSYGNGSFADKELVGTIGSGCLGSAIADFDNDGDSDLTIQNVNGDSYLFINNGIGGFAQTKVAEGLSLSNYSAESTTADFNNDGHCDAIVGQDDDVDPGQTWLYKGDGTGNFTYFGEAYDTNPSIESGGDCPGAGCADAYDFDGDGNLDVVASAEPARGGEYGTFFFKGNGDGTFQDSIKVDDFIGRGISAPPLESRIVSEFFDDFSTDSEMWTYVGSAYRDPTNEYVVLTENKNGQVGIIWFNRSITSAFTIEFKYKAGGGFGADGLVFMFYKDQNYLPDIGGSLGFIGSGRSSVHGYGVEFDNYGNSWDPSSNHIALIKDSVSNHLKYVNDGRTEDNKWHNVTVRVNDSGMSVDVDGSTPFTWSGELNTTYGGFGFGAGTGDANNWHIIDDVRIKYTPTPYTISISEDQTTTIGGNALYTFNLQNLKPVPITLDLSLTGLTESWYTLSKPSVFLIAYEEEDIILNITVPDDCTITGTYPFKVFAGSKSVTGGLNVVAEPIISELIPPDSAILSSNDVLFSWRTSVNSTTEVYIKAENEANFTQVIGDSGFIHAITVTDLRRNVNYVWYARSCSACGCAVSPHRTFYIDNGIVFTKDKYEFTVERDYDQHVSVAVKNKDSEPHELLLQAMNPYEDLIVGFVGNGSMDKIISLAPGETKDIEFVIHAQDVVLREYEFAVNLTNLGAENITDFAVVHVNVRWPNIDFDITEIDSDPVTLVKTFRITNYGDTITDLKVFAGDELKDKIIFEPSIEHGRLGSGSSVGFKAKLVVKAGCMDGDCYGVNGTISAQGAGKTVNVSADFSCEEGKKLFVGSVANYSLSFCKVYDEDDSPNTNPMSGAEVESYLVNGSKMFVSQVILDIRQNGRKVYGVNISLRVWNSSSEILLNGVSDKFGRTLFTFYGPISNYSYKAILPDFGIETETRNFSVSEITLYDIEPYSIEWTSISDSNTTYTITSDFNKSVILDNSPFIFKAGKDVIEENETTKLLLQWDIDKLKTVLISGTIENNTLLFNTSGIPPRNYTATIIAISGQNVSLSRPIHVVGKDKSAIYKQQNYTFWNTFPINSTNMIALKINHSVLSSEPETVFDLSDIKLESNNSEYKFIYVAVANETKTAQLVVKAESPDGTIYNYTSIHTWHC